MLIKVYNSEKISFCDVITSDLYCWQVYGSRDLLADPLIW